MSNKFFKKYVPDSLTSSDRKKQIKSIKEGTDRPKLKSFKSRRSKWTVMAEKYFGKNNTGKKSISLKLSGGAKKRNDEIYQGLSEIYDKGVGAYYSSGSRPNQTPYSWAMARVFSVLFGGKSRNIDIDIVKKYNLPLLYV